LPLALPPDFIVRLKILTLVRDLRSILRVFGGVSLSQQISLVLDAAIDTLESRAACCASRGGVCGAGTFKEMLEIE
jgi:hypothetical protein